LLLAVFGEYDIKESVINIMSTKKIPSLCVMSVIIVGILFTSVSCAKIDENASSPTIASVKSSLGSSTAEAAEKDITTEANRKSFDTRNVLNRMIKESRRG
jgi:hypothetical protein